MEAGAILGCLSLVGVTALAIAYRRQAKQVRWLRERLTGEPLSRGAAGREPAEQRDRRRFEAPRDLAAAAAVVLAIAVAAVLATVVLTGT